MAEQRQVANVHDLPHEMLLNIFSFLDTATLLGPVKNVSSHWCEIVRHSSLYRRVVFDGHEITTKEAVELLSMTSRRLKSLTISNRADTFKLLKKVSGRNFRLEMLVIKRCQGNHRDLTIPMGLLRRLIKNSPNLRILKVKLVLGTTGRYLFKDLNLLSNLRSLDFGMHPQNFSSADLRTVTEGCRNLEEFSVFSFDRNSPIEDDDLELFCTKMSNSLRMLKLNAEWLSDRSVLSIVKCRKLRILSLHNGHKLTYPSISKLSELQCLTSLDLKHTENISSQSWIRFFWFPNMRNLQVLGLSVCIRVDDFVLECIATNCKALRKLRLFGCAKVTAYGLKKILVACKELKSLNVVRVNAARYSFPFIVSHCPGLEVLVYGKAGVLNADIESANFLNRSLPNLKTTDVALQKGDGYFRCFR